MIMQHFHKISPERRKIEELNKLTHLPRSYTYSLKPWTVLAQSKEIHKN